MSDIVKECLCATCKTKCENCERVQIKNQGNCKVYKCLNYKEDTSKICPYKKFEYCIRSNNDKIKTKKLYS